MRNGYDLLQEIIFLAGSADVASASIYFSLPARRHLSRSHFFHSLCVAVNISAHAASPLMRRGFRKNVDNQHPGTDKRHARNGREIEFLPTD